MQEFSLVFLVIAIVLIFFLFKKRKELHLGNPQLFLYALIGLIICIRSLYAFTEISSPGVDFFTGVLIVIFAMLSFLVGLLCIAWALMIYPKVKEKLPSIVNHKLLNNYTTPVVLIIIMSASNSIESIADSKQSTTLGFSAQSHFKDAKRNNIYSPEEYSAYLVNKKAKEEKEKTTKQEENKPSETLYTIVVENSLSSPQNNIDITVSFDKKSPFDMSVLKEIEAYSGKSFKRDRAAMIFRDYGVRLSDFDQYVLPKCSAKMQQLKREYSTETDTWLPYSFDNKAVYENEKRYRDNYNKQYIEKSKIALAEQNDCFYKTSQSLQEHSPRSKPKD